MFLKVIACEIFFREICHLAARSKNLLDLEFLTQGYHDIPKTGCAEIQKAAEGAARNSGNERLAKTIHGGGTLIGGLLPIGYEEEQTIGQAIALQVVARYGGVYDQPELTRYVNLVGRSVALTCDRADIDYRFAVLNHDSIYAFAAPAGYIFATRGLLKTIKSEAELAAVLGHEIGHVTQKHILDVIQRSKQIAGVAEAGLAYANKNPDAFKNIIDGAVKKLLDEGLDQGKMAALPPAE